MKEKKFEILERADSGVEVDLCRIAVVLDVDDEDWVGVGVKNALGRAVVIAL